METTNTIEGFSKKAKPEIYNEPGFTPITEDDIKHDVEYWTPCAFMKKNPIYSLNKILSMKNFPPPTNDYAVLELEINFIDSKGVRVYHYYDKVDTKQKIEYLANNQFELDGQRLSGKYELEYKFYYAYAMQSESYKSKLTYTLYCLYPDPMSHKWDGTPNPNYF